MIQSGDENGNFAVQALAIHPADHNLIWAAGRQWNGYRYATVVGEANLADPAPAWAFETIPEPSCEWGYLYDLVVCPHDPAVQFTCGMVYTGYDYNPVLFKTTDGGDTWLDFSAYVTGASQINYALDLDPQDCETLFLANAGSGLLRSTAGGVSWENLGLHPAENVVIDPLLPSYIWSTSYYGVHLSRNGGGDWETKTGNLPYTWLSELALNPARPWSLYLGTSGAGAFRSTLSDHPLPVFLAEFRGERSPAGVVLTWEINLAGGEARFHVWRARPSEARERLTGSPIVGDRRFELVDAAAPAEELRYWLEEASDPAAPAWFGPLAVAALAPRFALAQNFPNPFNPETTIGFSLPDAAPVHLDIHDAAGRRVASLLAGAWYPAGRHTIDWDGRTSRGRPASAGVYFYHLVAGPHQETRRMVLLK